MTAPERIWAYPSYVTGWDSANAHSRYILNSDEYILASHVTDMIRQAVQAEREACAKVADVMAGGVLLLGGAAGLSDGSVYAVRRTAESIAAAIRARKGE